MEEDLDEIAEGKVDNKSVLRAFYEKFEFLISEALKNVVKTPAQETGEMCPHCNSPMVIKKSKHGEFEACSNYPNCKYIMQEEKEKKPTEIIEEHKDKKDAIKRKEQQKKEEAELEAYLGNLDRYPYNQVKINKE